MTNPLVAKLGSFVDLPPDDLRTLDELCVDVRSLKARSDLIREGDRPEAVFLLLDGWACRYKLLPDGRRQIMAYLLPGDVCDIHVFILKEMDHAIGLLSDARVAAIPKQRMLDILDKRPALTRAFWWATLVDEGILREWLVNMGQRDAYDRIAHLFAEVWLRLKLVGRVDGGSFELPLTQADLGDTVGLTAVHVNRTLQRMRGEGLIELAGKCLRIPDMARLMDVTGFEANYLHQNRRGNGPGG